MSLHPRPDFAIPEETQRVAHAAFPKGTLGLRIAEELGNLYRDDQFADLFPDHGQPALAPAQLALASVLQFVEGLSDRQAADAVRGRIDWKYALGLELTDPGFDHTVLSEFRSRLVHNQAERRLLDLLLKRLHERGLIRQRGRQRTDSTHVLAAVRSLNRLERVGETLRAALNQLAILAPDWLQALAPPEWYQRYGSRVENYHLPKTDAARQELARVIAADGETLLAALDTATDQPWLAQIAPVVTLRRVWAEQYTGEPGQLRWREVQEMPSPAELISSPYDPEARYSTKREVDWVGYKVHLTEACDEQMPHLIVNVETTPATTPDDNMVAVVHESLQKRDLLPDEHLVDKGYTDSQVLIDSQHEYGVTIVGPVAEDPSWQARAGAGFDKGSFVVDWDRQVVTCPAGKPRLEGHAVLRVGVGEPGEALFARRASHHLPVPVHHEAPLVEARAGTRLPAGVLGHRADDGHAVLAQTGDEDVGIGVALVDQVLTRQQVAPLLRLMHHLDHIIVRCRGRRGRDIDNQVRPIRIAHLGEVHLVPHPFHLTLGAVACFRVVG
jgi:transposase